MCRRGILDSPFILMFSSIGLNNGVLEGKQGRGLKATDENKVPNLLRHRLSL